MAKFLILSSSTSRRNMRRQCVTEQSSTDESEVVTPTATAASHRDHIKSSTTTTSSSTSKTGSPSVSMTTLTQPLSRATRFFIQTCFHQIWLNLVLHKISAFWRCGKKPRDTSREHTSLKLFGFHTLKVK